MLFFCGVLSSSSICLYLLYTLSFVVLSPPLWVNYYNLIPVSLTLFCYYTCQSASKLTYTLFLTYQITQARIHIPVELYLPHAFQLILCFLFFYDLFLFISSFCCLLPFGFSWTVQQRMALSVCTVCLGSFSATKRAWEMGVCHLKWEEDRWW